MAPGRGVVLVGTGERASSLALGRQVVAAAARDVDTTASTAALTEADWRRRYATHLATLTRLEAHHHAGLIAGSGLAATHDAFVYEDAGEPLPLHTATAPAMSDDAGHGLETVRLRGDPTRRETGLSLPYRGARLHGEALHRQLDAWVERGTVEPDVAAAVHALAEQRDGIDLSDITVVVLGAGAQMGPLRSLLRWGAHVVAVDVPGPLAWQQILDAQATSSGRLSLPVPAGSGRLRRDEIAARAGVDVVADLPQVTGWLRSVLGAVTGPVALGTYVYADGIQHVRATVAVDALTQQLMGEDDRLSLAFLATPTDVYAVPMEVVEDSRRRYDRRAAGTVAAHGLSAGRLFTANYPDVVTSPGGDRFGLCDALVTQQGPNYALAKRIQRWRATQAWLSGRSVSINVAPATRTRSVVRNRLLAAAYSGAPRFGLEVFDPSTSSTLMAALLVHDLRNPRSSAPPVGERGEAYRLFTGHAVHGGMWRSGFAPRSVLGAAVVLGMVSRG